MADALSPTAPVKLVILPRTLAGMGRDGLRQYLETKHGPLVLSERDVSGRFSTYVHHYTQDLGPVSGGIPLDDRDAVTIIRFAALADLAASKASDAYRDRVGPDEDNFREAEGSVALFAVELEVAAGVDDAPRKLFIFRNIPSWDTAGWTAALGALVSDHDLPGAIVHSAKVVEGDFPFTQFDEIGLRATTEHARVAEQIYTLATKCFGVVDTKLLLVQTVPFI